MSGHKGYHGRSLEFLKSNNMSVGDSVRILADAAYSGIIMPRYEGGDDLHVVLKLGSGYNVGLETAQIKEIKIIAPSGKSPETAADVPRTDGLPKILLLSTGGTIASKIDYRTGAVTPALSAAELNQMVPELAGIANIDAVALLSEYSENIMPEHWLQIATKIIEYEKSEYAGIILTHGTDTMHYTSAFLSFALAGFPLPIVLVGSQRSPDRASSDAALNLIGAARLITEARPAGIYVAMHQDESDNAIACHVGTRVRKNHASKRGAFQTVGGPPAFVIGGDQIDRNYLQEFHPAGGFLPRIALDEKVALIKYHPGCDPRILESVIDMDYKAVIFEGTGLGHVGRVMHDSIKRAAERGIFLGMTSQCMDGRVQMAVYESGRDLLNLGITPLKDMIPEVALVKAMWAAGISGDSDRMRNIMADNIASEMSS